MTPRFVLLATLAAMGVCVVVLVVVTVVAKMSRERRARTLARLAAPQRLLVLEVASGEDDDGVATRALSHTSGAVWSSIRPAVVAMLGKVRGAPAAQLVAVLDAHGEIEVARGRLRSRSALRRARAAHLLGLVADEHSVLALIELLADPVPDVRQVAARSLGQIGDPSAGAALLESVRRGRADAAVPAWIVAEALLGMGPRIELALVDALVSPDRHVRAVAVTVTANSTMTNAISTVRECLHFETDPDIKAAMIEALGRLGGPGDAGLLMGYTGRYAPATMRRTTVAALGDLGDPACAPRLRELLSDADRATAGLAATALTRLGDQGYDILAAASTQGRDVARIASAALHLARLRSDAELEVTR